MTAATRTPDQQLAVDLAIEAGRLLVDLRSSGPTGRELGDIGDRRANTLLLERLAAARPDDAVLSEESADDLARVDADRVWIIDPVDGTREYGLGDRPDWAVHVALWERAGDPALARLTAAAVGLPALGVVSGVDDDEVYAAPVGNGGVDGGGLLPPRTGSRPRIVLSASRPPRFADAVAEAVGGDLVPLGSAGAKTAAVVRGEADAYIHAGGQYQWDSAAPAGVALARGFVAVRIDGTPLEYNVSDTYLPDLVVCRADLADAILGAIADEGAANR
ncbi:MULTISPECIES: 3'(2'),5'-bisphosphate nucleotidase CysQ [Dietzia]|uniref:3'(2'),5'-bisphosphate nucleotidase CysQ n=1 Tax=Dietzia TaxID=37914 RepID=UPI0013D7696B|nr:3'(2'),5'-bisphosphate nucleotidase CysQ [Dietzia sp. Alg238-R159]